MTAHEYLKYLRDRIPLPLTPETMKRADKKPSNSELARWLTARSVRINSVLPQPGDEIALPVRELVFFPKGKTRTYLQ